MTIQRLRGALHAVSSRRTACPSVICLMLLALIVMGLPALSGAQQTCQPDGDIDQNGSLTAADALLAFQQALSLTQLSMCQQSVADVFPHPASADGNITASDALCIFQKALGLPSCFDSVVPPAESPIVDAGPDQSIDAGVSVVLSGTASDPDGTVASYLWEQTGGTMVSLVGAASTTAVFNAPDVSADEVLTFRLTVADNAGLQSSDEVMVAVRRVNKPPVADAGFDQSVNSGSVVVLSGTASDPDGTVASYLWEQTVGTMVSLSGAASTTAVFDAPDVSADEMLTFHLIVTDNEGAQASDDVEVTVMRPVLEPLQTQFLSNMTFIFLNGAVFDGGLSGLETHLAFQTFRGARGGFRLLANGAIASGTAVIGTDRLSAMGVHPRVRSFNGAASSFSLQAGGGGTSATAMLGSCSLEVNASDFPEGQGPQAGTTIVLDPCALDADTGQLVLTNSSTGITARSDADNETPYADAGRNRSAEAGEIVFLFGTGSHDIDGTIVSYWWEQTAGTSVALTGTATDTIMFTAPETPVHATLIFRLTVTDDGGAQASDEVSVTVLAAEESRGFVSVSAGRGHTCGVRDTGAVECWGWDRDREATPPVGAFTSVSAGGSHTCGVRDTGAVECWGWNGNGQSTPPSGSFFSVSAGGSHTCGVRDTGEVQCWGDHLLGDPTPPSGAFFSVSAGASHTCGVRDTGEVQCWGYHGGGKTTPPSGTFFSVSAGGSHTCGVRDTGEVQCWGWNGDGQSTPPDGKFALVSASADHTCGVLRSGEVECWGDDDFGQSTPPAAGVFFSVSAGGNHTCGVLRSGEVECWGRNDRGQSSSRAGDDVGQTTPPAGIFVSVNAGGEHSCGIRDTGQVQCWGSNELGVSTPPLDTLLSISTGFYYSCGLRQTGQVQCWGSNELGVSTPPAGVFVSVSAGGLHSCGVLRSGEVQCWGWNEFGQSTPQFGLFVSVSAGDAHTCGLRQTGQVQCWGSNELGVSTPPLGTFISVSAGASHSCGLRRTGVVQCWGGGGFFGGSAPPLGAFVSVGTGLEYTCGMRDTGEIECWGWNDLGQSTPPAGAFTSLSVSSFHACGLRDTGEVECWGWSGTYRRALEKFGQALIDAALELAQ